MALSDLVLSKGEVIVILSDSTEGIIPADSGAVNFGLVQAVNDLCDTTSVGASVWFDKSKAQGFQIISGQIFYKVQEQFISAADTYLP